MDESLNLTTINILRVLLEEKTNLTNNLQFIEKVIKIYQGELSVSDIDVHFLDIDYFNKLNSVNF
jgi:hypothetical protein